MFVKNFILIDAVSLDFQHGLSAFTGETGAGKSLLMDAIGVLKGERASASMVKQGCEKAIIEGVFEIEHPELKQKLSDDGYELDDQQLIVTREITKDGKSTTRINRRVVNVTYVKEIVSALVDIHSQHDTQYLLNARYHLGLLDNFLNEQALQQRVASTYHAYKKVDDALAEALASDYNEEELEYLTFQLNEIDSAQLKQDELEALEKELKRMQSFEKITSALATAIDKLESQSNPALYESFRSLSGLDEELSSYSDRLSEYYYQIEEIASSLHSYADHMEYDEAAFNEIQDRIFLIHKLLRKYGGSFDDVMEKRDELERKIDSILHRQDFILKQETILKEAKAVYQKEADALHHKRVEKAKELGNLVQQQLLDLQLPHARFVIDLTNCQPTAHGVDKVEFMISMNAGEQLKPLAQTASGGELSRLMLGLKTVFTSLMGIETVIFDEIDTGVSGKVALAIGKKMQQLAKQSQVFCVTHLSPVAACAAQHYIVEKQQSETQTKTMISLLDEEHRMVELANIASGSHSESALTSARELYKLAQNK